MRLALEQQPARRTASVSVNSRIYVVDQTAKPAGTRATQPVNAVLRRHRHLQRSKARPRLKPGPAAHPGGAAEADLGITTTCGVARPPKRRCWTACARCPWRCPAPIRPHHHPAPLPNDGRRRLSVTQPRLDHQHAQGVTAHHLRRHSERLGPPAVST